MLDANPLENISNTARINAVVVNGRYFPTGELQNMLAQIQAGSEGMRGSNPPIMQSEHIMDSSDETIIELSKKKIMLVLLGVSAFVAAGIWMFSLDEASIQSERSYRLFFNNPTFVYGLGLVSIAVFGLLALFFFKKLFDKKPGLIFSASGIVDNASAVSAGFIPWSEVIGWEMFEMQGQKMLIIMVRDPQKYINRGNAVKRTLNQANYKMCGSPIAISSNALKINFSELRSVFDEYLRKYCDVSQQAVGSRE